MSRPPSPPDYSSSSSSSSSSCPPSSLFPHFPDLPPEIRHQIWLSALPSPGVNFFNVHVIPNDHPGANRSTSPPLARLDTRRLDIADDDGRDVARYDPSAWRARDALRRTCREARAACAIPGDKATAITLTRPRRGLFVRAGDGQLRRLTPLGDPRGIIRDGDGNGGGPQLVTADNLDSDPGVQDRPLAYDGKLDSGPEIGKEIEQLVYRTILVHVNDMLCLSIENCSFNLPFEESPFLRGGSDYGGGVDVDGLATGRGDSEDDEDEDMGWAYDPQFLPPLPPSLPLDRYCVNMARGSKAALRAVQDVLAGLVHPSAQEVDGQQQQLVMFDAVTQALGERGLEELTTTDEVFWDRFGDCYVPLPWDQKDLQAQFRLTKVCPETNDVRDRYLRSALLCSHKRPSQFFVQPMDGRLDGDK
ncbi:hypothetical protein F5X99DRAFT_113526 [Biscogniauxia marginata]|nr:hypothetical protein F5X99DRAFT_113526 [Biscogniauxia marginata]